MFWFLSVLAVPPLGLPIIHLYMCVWIDRGVGFNVGDIFCSARRGFYYVRGQTPPAPCASPASSVDRSHSPAYF